jgi:AcrR family transcriptional regulator
VRRSNKDRAEATQGALLNAARGLFVEKGYAETSTPEIVTRAAVTRGALYHHFTDKEALFRAVVEKEARQIAADIARDSSDIEEPLQALMKGTEAYFKAMEVPGRARLLLVEGPTVLGRSAMDELDRITGGQELLDGLGMAVKTYDLPDVPLEPLAEILSAALDRAALAISEGAEPAPYLTASKALLAAILRA